MKKGGKRGKLRWMRVKEGKWKVQKVIVKK
jgi:hypothetical protein